MAADSLEDVELAASELESAARFRVMDPHLAAALLACGVPLCGKCFLLDLGDGVERPVFPFGASSSDGLVDVKRDAAGAGMDPEKFIKENPMSPLSFALAALIQQKAVLDAMKSAPRVVAMCLDGDAARYYFEKDSALHRAAVRRGMRCLKGKPSRSRLSALCLPSSNDATS